MRWTTTLRVGRIAAVATLLTACGAGHFAESTNSSPVVVPSEVSGRVLGENGEPIPGANVSLWTDTEGGRSADDPDLVVVTAGDGRVSLPGVRPTEVRIRVVAPGYAVTRFRGRIREGDALLDLRVRRGVPLAVRVEDKEGRSVAGATVGLFVEPMRVFLGLPTYLRMDRSATTGADGTCVLTGLIERLYRVVAVTDGGEARGVVATVGGTTGVTVVLGREAGGHRHFRYGGLPGVDEVPPDSRQPEDPPPPDQVSPEEPPAPPAPEPAPETSPPAPPARARLVARVLSSDGVPVPGVFVTLRWAEDPDSARSLGQGSAGPGLDGFEKTEEDGIAALLLAPGHYNLDASPADFGTSAAEAHVVVDVAAGEEKCLEVRLPNVFAVPVETRSADGSPLERVRLEVRRGEKDTREWTGPDGRTVLFAEQGPGFRVLACPEGLPTVSSGPVELPREVPLVLQVPRGETLQGRVLDPQGTPLFGVEVDIRREGLVPPDQEEWTVWTDERGEFFRSGLAAGTYTVAGHSFAFRETLVRGVRVPGGDPVQVLLRRLPRIRGRVIGPSGAPLAGVDLVCDGGDAGCSASAADGTFEFAYQYAKEEAVITFSLDGYVSREVSVVPGEVRPLEVRLERVQ